MPPIFWTGKLSLTMKVLVNTSNLLAWISGNARDTFAMKQRMKRGYEGTYSSDISRYDELGLEHYTKTVHPAQYTWKVESYLTYDYFGSSTHSGPDR